MDGGKVLVQHWNEVNAHYVWSEKGWLLDRAVFGPWAGAPPAPPDPPAKVLVEEAEIRRLLSQPADGKREEIKASTAS
jgi:hypothetical protein